MSLNRLIYYSALGAGWAALAGWMIFEIFLFGRMPNWLASGICGTLVGGFVATSLRLVGGLATRAIAPMLKQLIPVLLAGMVGGVVGAGLGELLYSLLGLPRALGWMVMGLGIGAVEGLFERSPSKLRNGLIGGGIGGLLGGLLFDVFAQLLASPTGMTNRAVGFVVLGVCIGFGIGLVQVILKEAWLTVLDGYRPGRQLILSQDRITLGAGEWVDLPFMGTFSKGLETEHLYLIRQSNGSWLVEDNNSLTGVFVNGSRIQGQIRLQNGDRIKLGSNIVEFNESSNKADVSGQDMVTVTMPETVSPSPLPVRATAQSSPPVRTSVSLQPPIVAPTPVRPTAASGTTMPKPTPAAKPTLSRHTSPNGCPSCGRVAHGTPGQRFCVVCERTF
jgi:hypothetical protein